MNILIVSQYYPPEVGALATRMSSIARHLRGFGHNVTVLCEIPNYPTGIVEKKYKGKLWFAEKVDGIDVIRSYVTANPRKTNVQRIKFYISFMISAILKGLTLPQYDIVIATSPPLFVGIAGLLISKFVNAKFVFDVRDLWPESAFSLGEMNKGLSYSLAEKMELLLYRKAQIISVAVPGFKDRLMEKGVTAEKIVPLPNGVDVDHFYPCSANTELKQKYDLIDKFVVLFSGNHGLAQGLDTVIKAAQILKDHENIRFLFIGSGVEKDKLVQMKAKMGLTNIIFDKEQPFSVMPKIISIADVCLVPLKDLDLFKNALPSKMFEYMACGKPVLSTLIGEGRDVLEESGGGVSVSPENEIELAKAVINFYNNTKTTREYGNNAVKFVKTNYSKITLIKKFNDVIK